MLDSSLTTNVRLLFNTTPLPKPHLTKFSQFKTGNPSKSGAGKPAPIICVGAGNAPLTIKNLRDRGGYVWLNKSPFSQNTLKHTRPDTLFIYLFYLLFIIYFCILGRFNQKRSTLIFKWAGNIIKPFWGPSVGTVQKVCLWWSRHRHPLLSPADWLCKN